MIQCPNSFSWHARWEPMALVEDGSDNRGRFDVAKQRPGLNPARPIAYNIDPPGPMRNWQIMFRHILDPSTAPLPVSPTCIVTSLSQRESTARFDAGDALESLLLVQSMATADSARVDRRVSTAQCADVS
jgi:hypothetical protein